MVLGVFMAVLMVAVVYYVDGIGRAIVERERMQDATDAGVLASAAIHARGLNFLVLVNVSMVATLGVASLGRVVAFVAALIGFDGLNDRAEGAHQTAITALVTATQASATLAAAIPEAGAIQAAELARRGLGERVETVFPYPAGRGLPVEAAPLDELSSRAGVTFADLALRAFPAELRGVVFTFIDRDTIDAHAIRLSRDLAAQHGIRLRQVSGDAETGGERTQLRLVVGARAPRRVEAGVALATWGRGGEAEEEIRALESIGRVALGQAEYYFAGDRPRAEWLWYQEWTSRLRRVRLEDPGAYPCEQPSAACDALDAIFRRGLEKAIVH